MVTYSAMVERWLLCLAASAVVYVLQISTETRRIHTKPHDKNLSVDKFVYLVECFGHYSTPFWASHVSSSANFGPNFFTSVFYVVHIFVLPK